MHNIFRRKPKLVGPHVLVTLDTDHGAVNLGPVLMERTSAHEYTSIQVLGPVKFKADTVIRRFRYDQPRKGGLLGWGSLTDGAVDIQAGDSVSFKAGHLNMAVDCDVDWWVDGQCFYSAPTCSCSSMP